MITSIENKTIETEEPLTPEELTNFAAPEIAKKLDRPLEEVIEALSEAFKKLKEPKEIKHIYLL
jgi:DNA-directed RNA polymerase specialized sigma24 family protein